MKTAHVPKKRLVVAAPVPVRQALWPGAIALLLSAVALLGLFSTEIADTDFWWHLKTGQYIVEHRSLPVPDPFSYTTALNRAAYPGEDRVQRFNLTHEWLSQVLIYLAYVVGGFPAIVLTRAVLLAALCGVAGFLSARLSGSFPAGVTAAFATASVAVAFTADRPAIVTFLGVAVFVAVLELRRAVWVLPVLALAWANCHSGFFLGWLVLLAYCVEWRTVRDRRRLWLVTACSIAVSCLNPNGYGVLSALVHYRQSDMTRNLVEWQPASWWEPPYGFNILLYAAALVLGLAWKRVRPAHWMLFAAFTGASILAFRNILLIGFLAPVLIAAYFPYRLRIPPAFAWAAPSVLAVGLLSSFAGGGFFQLRAAEWTTPDGAADFLLANHVAGPLFNTYEQGGYLIWKLWPEQRVFIDGRSLSETVYRDYRQILFNESSAADQVSGPREQLLEHYGIDAVVMNTLDYASGALYPLALALANPASQDWQLVYDDPRAVVFLRHPPASVAVFPNKLGRVLNHLDQECAAYIEHSPDTPLCARTLADYWLRNGVKDRARRMLTLYLEHARKPDPKAETVLRQLE